LLLLLLLLLWMVIEEEELREEGMQAGAELGLQQGVVGLRASDPGAAWTGTPKGL
jgi:hypothetical protein